jgi:hypothetical protein
LAEIPLCSICSGIRIFMTHKAAFRFQLLTINFQLLAKRIFSSAKFRPYLQPPEDLAAKNGFFEGQKIAK